MEVWSRKERDEITRYTFLFETRVCCTRLCKYETIGRSLDWTPACSSWHDSSWCSSTCRRKAPLAANTSRLYALPSHRLPLNPPFLLPYYPSPLAGHSQQNPPPRPPPRHPPHRPRRQVRHPARRRHPRRPRAPAILFLILLSHRPKRKDSQLRLHPPRPLR